jgi:hypothetical protein
MRPVSRLLKLVPLLFVLITIAFSAMAQPNTPNTSTIFEEIDDVPINGAIALLTSAGIGLGIKKLYSRKK